MGKRNILRDVSLSVSEPLVFLLGLNGSGKTTLLRAISGELPYEGSIKLGQEEIQSIAPKLRAGKIAVVHQRLNLPFQLTLSDFVLMGRFAQLGTWGNYTKGDRERALQEMTRLGIADLADRHLDEVSGGELQKALLARALCQDADWLLLDEPGQQLDPRNRAMLYHLLSELAAEGCRIFCSTHDREAVEQGGGRILGMRDGQIVLDENGPDWDRVWDVVYGHDL